MLKVNKRIGVFETNSSSSHSVSVAMAENDKVLKCHLDVTEEDGEKIIYIEPGEFEWETESYSDAETKLSYLITYLFEFVKKDNIHLSLLHNLGTEKKELYDKLERIVCDFCDADRISVCSINNSWNPFGSIDHQSTDVAINVLNEDDDYILNFIFNPNSVLYTDNDNH